MPLLSLQNITLHFGAAPLLDGVNFQIERGERVCLLGRNGAGKSSLLRILTGDTVPDGGDIVFQSGTRVARLAQEVPPSVDGTVYEIVAGGAHENVKPYELEAIISRLKLEPDAEFSSLSGGLKRRAWLGRTLAGQPDVLILDEPTNHLDIDSIMWLEEFLLRHVRTLIFVTHDRAFLRRLATRIVEIDRGQLLNWECDYDTYLVRKEAALDAEEKQRALFDKRLAQEESWIRHNVEARRTHAQSRIRALFQMREERRARREQIGLVQMQLQTSQRSGALVAEAENINFAYVSRPVIRDFSTIIMRGDKVGIIGPNGSGKTTLLRILLGDLEPQSGDIKLGTRREIAYFDQLRAQLDDEKSVRQNVCGDMETVNFNGVQRHIIGYLQEFLFDSARANSPVSVLSGGERNRLLLAKLFTQPANILVMDEPTNDLDMETLDLLENLLVEFKGTLLLVSHDRQFLNDVVASTLVFEPDGDGGFILGDYAGGYDDYLNQRPQVVEAKSVSKSASPKAAPRPRKMSQKETRELEALPRRIEELEKLQHEIAARMADPALYQNGGALAVETKARLAEVEGELEKVFARWEELLEMENGVSS